jgi:hypothetical protein
MDLLQKRITPRVLLFNTYQATGVPGLPRAPLTGIDPRDWLLVGG